MGSDEVIEKESTKKATVKQKSKINWAKKNTESAKIIENPKKEELVDTPQASLKPKSKINWAKKKTKVDKVIEDPNKEDTTNKNVSRTRRKTGTGIAARMAALNASSGGNVIPVSSF